jgi:glycosyltransferase involved in cell wall biosynthesis
MVNLYKSHMKNIELSIIVPVKNEEGSIKIQNDKIHKALKGKIEYEVIWVDDGSTDSTPDILKEISNKHTKGISLMRNVGQSGALMAGIDHSSGKYIGTMDGDNQNDPDELLTMIKKIEDENLDAVVGWRQNRWKGNVIRRLPSLLANAVMRRSFKMLTIHDAGCPVKVIKASVMKEVRLYGELHRFLSYIIAMHGARLGEIPVNHRERETGVSKYGISRTFTVLFDILNIKFLMMRKRTPIQVLGPLALLTYAIAFISGIVLLISEFTVGIDVSGSPFFTISIISAVMGTQFITFGLLGELIIRSYYENGKEKKTYLIRDMH